MDFVPASLSYRNAFGSVFLPYAAQLAALGDIAPHAFLAFDSATLAGLAAGQVGAQQSALSSFSTPEDCWVTHLVGSGVPVGGGAVSFAVQFYDSGRQKLWSPQPILFSNAAGSAQQPFWLKKLYRLPAGQQFQCRVINMRTVATAIQIVLWGLKP